MEIEVKRSVIDMEYPVRGPIPDRAEKLKAQGREIKFCNIGNPNAFEDLTPPHYRRVLSAVEDPARIELEKIIRTAGLTMGGIPIMSNYELKLVSKINEGIKTRAYTHHKGAEFIRHSIRDFISKRDNGVNVPAFENIFLTNGASEGAHFVMAPQIINEKSAIMIPRPQYPFYSAEIVKQGGQIAFYDPIPELGWSVTLDVLEEGYQKAVEQGQEVKLLTIINPQNPTGAVATKQEIVDAINFANNKGIGIMFDEVYQDNTYGKEFISGGKMADGVDIPIYTFHSASKGFVGACGDRGGYVTITNPPKVKGTDENLSDIINTIASQRLCPNTAGQKMVYLMINPPEESDGEVFNEYAAKRDKNLGDMEKKAGMLRTAFESMDGVSIHGDTGAMYLFPELPKGVNDFNYAMSMLDETDLCTVNGKGFGKPGFLRIAFLPKIEEIAEVTPKLKEFHNNYMAKHH